MTTSKPALPWVRQAVSLGLFRLTSLNLSGGPRDGAAAKAMLDTWLVAIGTSWTEADRPRFEAAFLHLLGSCTWWPAPANFLEALPRATQSSPGNNSHSAAISPPDLSDYKNTPEELSRASALVSGIQDPILRDRLKSILLKSMKHNRIIGES